MVKGIIVPIAWIAILIWACKSTIGGENLHQEPKDPRISVELGMDGKVKVRYWKLRNAVRQPSRLLTFLARLDEMATALHIASTGTFYVHLLHRPRCFQRWPSTLWCS